MSKAEKRGDFSRLFIILSEFFSWKKYFVLTK